ncbi:MAG: DUF3021 domain-containing protein [Oscillospiraceae bacterium]|nr:DUF3021 domain-containing protein [Oscillospiraceae bacterium]
MNKYFKEFLHRGMLYGGFGPIIAGIIFWILSITLDDFALTGGQVLLAIVSTYVLAFVQAGASVFNQIEHWSLAKSLLWHFLSIYLAYVLCYTVNSWIPFEPMVIVIFTAIFAVTYFIVWFSVYFAIKATEKKLNKNLRKLT